ncbi:MAG: hypothetical protein EZS28_003321 [Streblomastix strix]|uniref:Uncharacterized protein n=1 Tax=Streblomastix strix TaxID=222440 RepID=A0A5J4X2D0_9EUKA|nr:MAG: hypothetical protein EZS28_003321 [Streblomastix strix]
MILILLVKNYHVKHISKANGDFSFSADSGTLWMYEADWYNSGDIVPDQVTPASESTHKVDIETGIAGISNNFARVNHKHPLNVSDEKSKRDNSVEVIETSTAYSSADHQHPLNTDPTLVNKPVKDIGSGV